MAVEIIVPSLSESVIDATVSEWLKKEGDPVEAGEAVVVLETDKVSVDVTADASGVLGKIAAQEGEDVQAGDVLGLIEGSDDATVPSRPTIKEKKAEAAPQSEPATAPAENSPSSVTATPVAQRMASEHGVNLSKVQASGDKITKDDVQRHLDGQKTTQSTPVPQSTQAASTGGSSAFVFTDERGEDRQKMSRRRRTIAKRLIEAQQTAAMLTTFNEIDMSAVIEVRTRRKEAFKEKHGVSLGFSSFFVKASIGALKAFPAINAEIQGDEIVYKNYYDIGIAIGAEDGLVVPVVRNADQLSFAQIEQKIREYAIQARDGKLEIESLMGGTFTITNGGVFGSMMSTPILNPPQVGILGLHAITDRAIVVDGEITIRPMMYVALTYDHRIVDGREAVQFLVKVKELIEDPESLLIEG